MQAALLPVPVPAPWRPCSGGSEGGKQAWQEIRTLPLFFPLPLLALERVEGASFPRLCTDTKCAITHLSKEFTWSCFNMRSHLYLFLCFGPS